MDEKRDSMGIVNYFIENTRNSVGSKANLDAPAPIHTKDGRHSST